MSTLLRAMMAAVLLLVQPFFINRTFGPAPAAYSASAQFTLPTGAALNDFVTFRGSNTATIYITSIDRACIIGTAVINWTNIGVRRTSETGGTFTQWQAVPYDKNSPAATATMGDYHVALTTGNSGGSVFLERIVMRTPVNSSGTFEDNTRNTYGIGLAHYGQYGQLFDRGSDGLGSQLHRRPASPLVLRGTNDIIGLTTSFAPANGIRCNFNVQWFEVPNNAP